MTGEPEEGGDMEISSPGEYCSLSDRIVTPDSARGFVSSAAMVVSKLDGNATRRVSLRGLRLMASCRKLGAMMSHGWRWWSSATPLTRERTVLCKPPNVEYPALTVRLRMIFTQSSRYALKKGRNYYSDNGSIPQRYILGPYFFPSLTVHLK